jgi:GTP cyclohydrolase I
MRAQPATDTATLPRAPWVAAGSAGIYDELVLAREIPFRTVCEHHLLPFSGVAHVGYLPGERVLGLSARKLELISQVGIGPAPAAGPAREQQTGR